MFRFTIRDLLWLMVLVSFIRYAYQDRQAVLRRVEKREAELKVQTERQAQVVESWNKAIARIQSGREEARRLDLEELERHKKKLDAEWAAKNAGP